MLHRLPTHVLLASLAALVPLSGCASIKPPREASVEGLGVGRLKEVNPLDVVVLPIENHSGRAGLPLDTMRREFQEGLVKLRYSPLALDYVDRQVVEATYNPGDLREQAVLQVFVTGWDDRLWSTHTKLTVDAEVFLLDARNPEAGQALWGGRVSRKLDLARERAAVATDERLLAIAVEEFVQDVLSTLPARNPQSSAPR
jgi:hypothetical protein